MFNIGRMNVDCPKCGKGKSVDMSCVFMTTQKFDLNKSNKTTIKVDMVKDTYLCSDNQLLKCDDCGQRFIFRIHSINTVIPIDSGFSLDSNSICIIKD